jgi:hypothetical protein
MLLLNSSYQCIAAISSSAILFRLRKGTRELFIMFSVEVTE